MKSDEKDIDNLSAPKLGIVRRELLLMRLWALLAYTRACAKRDYQRQTTLPELQRNLIGLIGNFGDATSTELVMLTGRDKGQISHALADLRKLELLERSRLRSPLRLTNLGKHLFEQFVEISAVGDAAITEGISRVKLARFLTTLQRITDTAAVVLTDEQAAEQNSPTLASHKAEPAMSTFPDRLRNENIDRPLSLMVTPKLMGLFAYLERGATLTYRRSMNISLFETIIISQLGDVVEMPLSELIGNIDRNKGQVGRTIKSLEDNGLVEYSPISTSRRAVLRLTELGRGMARQMIRIAIERDEALMEGVSADERETFAQVLTELTANAAQRLHSLQGNSG